VVIAAQEAEALDILRSTAASRAAPLRYLPEEVDIQEPTIDHDGSTARLVFRDRTLFAAPLEARLRLVGEIQLKNAAVAAIAVRTAFPDISDRIITEGLAKATLPARFERISDDPPTIIDGAHTVSSAALVADAFSRLYGDGGVLLFGCALGKSAAPMAAILAPRFADVIVTRPGDFKKSDPGKTNEEFSRYTNRARLIEDTDEAVRRAIALARERGVPLLVTGSFYLASIVRAHPALAPILTKKNLA
jgi:dihydrofolate synthase/folylpolyglutamate synthase